MGLAIGAMAALSVVVGSGLVSHPPSGPTASPGGSGPPLGVGGPVVFYEIDDADGAKLMVRTLDGHSLARLVATRADLDESRTWSVDPTGTTAIAATNVPTGGSRLEGVSTATGATLWSVDLPSGGVTQGVWSSDGRRFATITDPDNPADRDAVIVDAASGIVERTAIPDDAALQGFDPDGGLILRQHRPSRDGANTGWQFLRIDPASGLVQRLTALPEVGPASGWNEDVDPAAGIGFDQAAAAEDETKTALRIWSVGSSTNRVVATFPMIDRMAMDPTGQAVAISVQKSILLVARDGRTVEIWSGQDPATIFDWSSSGSYLGVMTDQTGHGLFVVERSSFRIVELPLPASIAQAAFVRILDGNALPQVALPAVEPTPTPTPGPSGPDIATSDGVLVAWIAPTDTGAILHVERRVPTTDGGMRIVAAMGPSNVGPTALVDDREAAIVLLPRPGSRDVLVWVQTPDRTFTWLWAADGVRRDVPLPPDWPATTFDLAWRPDGKAIAASALVTDDQGAIRDAIAIGPLNGRKTTILELPDGLQYNRLEGWWSPSELRLGHGICTEGCPGRYAWSSRMRIAGGRLTELTAADRVRGPVDTMVPGVPSGLDMLPGNDMPESTIHIDWPASLGPNRAEFVGFAADGRSLIVSVLPEQGTDVYRIDDPAARAIDGRLADPRPILLGHLAQRGVDIRISPDERWALTIDRTGGILLTELGTGRNWPIDRDSVTTWASAN